MLQNTINWYNGEIFEAKFILAFGFFAIVSSLLFFFLGDTPTAKALLIPMLAIGIFFSATGATMIYSNSKKVREVDRSYNQSPLTFVNAEIKRVIGFQYLYPLSIGISAVSFMIAMGILYLSKNVHLQATAIALILFGTAFAFIDYFSKERAAIYYEQLQTIKP